MSARGGAGFSFSTISMPSESETGVLCSKQQIIVSVGTTGMNMTHFLLLLLLPSPQP
jgi:hypothetical protein